MEKTQNNHTQCKTEQDHVWKQITDWESHSHREYQDSYGHPEDRMSWEVTYERATFECQRCGLKKELRK